MATMKNDDDIVKEVVRATPTKPTRGRGGKNNFPQSKVSVETEDDKQLVSTLLTEVLVEHKQPKVQSDEELVERIDDYFRRCALRGQVPTVEEMCMSTGYAQSTIWDWENGRRQGFSSSTAEIIKKAKDVAEEFANFLCEPVKKVIKNYENSQDFYDYVKLFATYQCTFDADKFQVLREKAEPNTTIIESTTEWQTYLKELDAKKQVIKELEL